jgi:hypothetical protein
MPASRLQQLQNCTQKEFSLGETAETAGRRQRHCLSPNVGGKRRLKIGEATARHADSEPLQLALSSQLLELSMKWNRPKVG